VNLSEPFIRRPVATSLMMGAVAFLGLAAFPFLPIAPLPQVDFPTVQVTATLAGASAETMASSVATPLERQIGQIAGITQMTSFSALGATSITVQFDLNRNIDLAAQDIQAAIAAASKTLPQTMTAPPTYKKLNPADAPILILSAQSDTLPITVVDEYADSFLALQISQVPGVALVSLGGEQRPAIRIQADPAKLAARGLTLEDIRGALVNATTNAPKGSLTTARTSLTIEANDQIVEPKPFEDVIVAYRNGAPVRVRDIGRAVAAATDRFSAAYHDAAPARVEIIDGPRRGASANFLFLSCAENLVSEYYAFCDQDDVWEAAKLERAIDALERTDPGIPALYGSRTRLVDEAGNEIGFSPLFHRKPEFRSALVQSIAGGNTMVFNQKARELLVFCGADVDVPSHDWWLYQITAACGGYVHYDACPSVSYRQHADNVIGANMSWAARTPPSYAATRAFPPLGGSERSGAYTPSAAYERRKPANLRLVSQGSPRAAAAARDDIRTKRCLPADLTWQPKACHRVRAEGLESRHIEALGFIPGIVAGLVSARWAIARQRAAAVAEG